MFSKPKYGWSNITIEDWTDRCSYLDDIPFLFLNAFKDFFEKRNTPIGILLDAEGWEYIILLDWINTFIITDKEGDKEGYSLTTIPIGADYLAREVVADIRRDIDDWVTWECWKEMAEDQKATRKYELLTLCDVVEGMIP